MEVRLAVQAAEEVGGKAGVGGMVAAWAVVETAVARAAAKAVEACEHTQESRTGTFRRAHMVKYKRRGGCALGSCKR